MNSVCCFFSHVATQNKREHQQQHIAGDFGNLFWGATNAFSCAAHSTEAQSLQVYLTVKVTNPALQPRVIQQLGRNN